MSIALTVVYLFISILLIGLILLQQGKGANAGVSFGAGASATMFGVAGRANFLTRLTAILTVLFFGLSIYIGSLGSKIEKPASTFDNLSDVAVSTQKTPAKKDDNSDIPK